jgi:predicted RNA-binding protein YlqC (UPF0109 family)
MHDDEKYLYNIISPIVSLPEEISIIRQVDDKGVLLSLTINKADMGIIIGKDGDTARAIRKLIRQYAANRDAHISLKIIEPIKNGEIN